MKNLKSHVQSVWDQPLPSKKRELLHGLIDYSSAKDKTKILAHAEVDRMPDYKLDFFAANYWQSGEGHKVIK